MIVAWDKPIVIESGITVPHWVLDYLIVDIKSGMADARCSGYLSSDYVDKDFKLCQAVYKIDFSQFDPNGQITDGLVQLISSGQSDFVPPSDKQA